MIDGNHRGISKWIYKCGGEGGREKEEEGGGRKRGRGGREKGGAVRRNYKEDGRDGRVNCQSRFFGIGSY